MSLLHWHYNSLKGFSAYTRIQASTQCEAQWGFYNLLKMGIQRLYADAGLPAFKPQWWAEARPRFEHDLRNQGRQKLRSFVVFCEMPPKPIGLSPPMTIFVIPAEEGHVIFAMNAEKSMTCGIKEGQYIPYIHLAMLH